jgi:FkbM family methyltransferase
MSNVRAFVKKIPFARTLYRGIKAFGIGCARNAVGLVQGTIDRSPRLSGLAFDGFKQEFALANGAETFVVSTGDKVIGRELYATSEFDFAKFKAAVELAGLDDRHEDLLFVDIGANIGPICIPVVKRGYASRALAIEPELLNRKLLTANVVLNDLCDRIEVFPVALGAAPGTVSFELSERNFGDHRIKADAGGIEDQYGEADRKTVQVDMTTLDTIMEKQSAPNVLLWMDTQGYEGFVLQGATETLKRKHPMVLEFWPYGMKRSGSFDSLLECLCASPYEVFIDLDDPRSERVPLNRASLRALYERLGVGSKFTDIMLL